MVPPYPVVVVKVALVPCAASVSSKEDKLIHAKKNASKLPKENEVIDYWKVK